MDYTKNYKLNKPAPADYYNIEDFNRNADIIDEKLSLGAQGYELSQQLLSRVQELEAKAEKVNLRARILMSIYAPAGTAVTIRKENYPRREFTVPESGKLEFEAEETGRWTFDYKYRDKQYGKSVEIMHIGEVPIALAPDLAVAEWDYIDLVGKLGLAQTCWNIGETKQITVGDESVTVEILDFDHDKLYLHDPGRGKPAAITFGITKPLAKKVSLHPQVTPLSWSRRNIFTTYLPNLKKQLPEDLQRAIKTVRKVALKPYYNIRMSQGSLSNIGGEEFATDLFIFSETEIFGERRMGNPLYRYETVYEYYRRGKSFLRSGDYWLRSIDYYTSGDVRGWGLFVDKEGYMYSEEMNKEHGLLFGFCV